MVALFLALGLGLIAGCSKSNPPAPPASVEPAPPKVDLFASCEPAAISAVLAEIAKEEAAKAALDSTAKTTPEKSNFRKLYDAEIAFAAAIEKKLAHLKKCGASHDTQTTLKQKSVKSMAEALYLRETFPDFK